ncbi:hypothetical protein ACO0KY_10310 [Undibacterium sp. Dicai25W]|uniref:hypothetical protein n=1 Tax=Undibacterium sp. Dicai25W TaxID=3413034 RepID=UPI003BF14C19
MIVAISILPVTALYKAICASQKMEKKASLSERSEFRRFPIFCDAQIVPTRSDGTRRAKSQRRLSFAYFALAKQRKVSGCRATPACFYEGQSICIEVDMLIVICGLHSP